MYQSFLFDDDLETFGAASPQVSVIVNGYSPNPLDSSNMRADMLAVLKNEGWSATTIHVAKRAALSGSHFFTITVGMKVANTTMNELRRIYANMVRVFSMFMRVDTVEVRPKSGAIASGSASAVITKPRPSAVQNLIDLANGRRPGAGADGDDGFTLLPSGTEILKAFFASLGISLPIAIIGGGLILILMLKK
jgi:hypothetical protein